jgi:heme A synthase
MEYASAPAEKGANNTRRALAVILFILLLVGSFIMLAAATDVAGTTLCSDVTTQFAAQHPNGSCFDGSQLQKVLYVTFGYASGGVGAIAALSAIWFAITGRRGRLVAILSVGAVVLAGIGILVGNV